ncbi:MAG: tetratricopeptide repeat protein [Gammaproteobacteria bacterium]
MSPTDQNQPKNRKVTLDQSIAMVGQLIAQDKIALASKLCDQILSIAPQHPHVLNYQGMLAMKAREWQKALAYLEQAIRQQPQRGDYLNHYSHALLNTGQLDKANQFFQKALFYSPGNFSAHYGLALTCLTQGDYEKGWRHFEWRLFLPSMAPRYPLEKRWQGEHCDSLLLYSDDNAAHLFMMLRFLPILKKKVNHLLLEVGSEYIPLLKQYKTIDKIIPKGNPIKHQGVNLPIMSIPNVIKLSLDDLPFSKNYIKSVKKPPIPITSHFNIGIGWKTISMSIPLEKFIPLLENKTYHFYNLQEKIDKTFLENHPSITDASHFIKDFSDMAAMIDACHLIITADPALAHLSGAMGKKTWLLLPHYASWQWLTEKNSSPWEPNVILFRQPKVDEWDSVLQAVIQALRQEKVA